MFNFFGLHFGAYEAIVLVFIVLLVVLEWRYQRTKIGAEAATLRSIFGFIMFGLFYGIMKALWWVSGYAVVLLVVWFLYEKVSKKIALIFGGSIALIIFVSYLALRYSIWIFFFVGLIMVFQMYFVWKSMPNKKKS